MKKLIMMGVTLLFAMTAEAGLFKNSVDLADPSEVPAEKIESLRDTEFQVFLAGEVDKATRNTSTQAAKVGPLKERWEAVARNPLPDDGGDE